MRKFFILVFLSVLLLSCSKENELETIEYSYQKSINTLDDITVYTYPNPCSNLFILSYQASSNGELVVKLINRKGNYLSNFESIKLQNQGAVFSFDVSKLGIGIYKLEVLLNGQLMFQEDLMILR